MAGRRRLLWLLALIPLPFAVLAFHFLAPRPRPQVEGRPAALLTGTRNILIIGRDARALGPVTREGLVRQQREESSHSDVMMLAHVNLDLGRVNLVGIPRDLLVEVPGVTQAESSLDFTNMEKLTHVYAIGGDHLLRRTIELLLGIKIHRSMAFDFDTFRMTFGVLAPFIGRLRVSGVALGNRQEALKFARRRHGLPQDDIDRCRNDLLLVRAILGRTWWLADTRLGEITLRRILRIVGNDTDLTLEELLAIAATLNANRFEPAEIRTAVLAGEGAEVTLTRYNTTLFCYLPAYGEIRRQAARYLLDEDDVEAIDFMTRERFPAPGYLFANYVLDTLTQVLPDSTDEVSRRRELESQGTTARPESAR